METDDAGRAAVYVYECGLFGNRCGKQQPIATDDEEGTIAATTKIYLYRPNNLCERVNFN